MARKKLLFKTICADPPWPYDSPGEILRASLKHRPNRDKTELAQYGPGSKQRYGALSIAELCDLKIPIADNAHLYLWTTNSFMVEAHEIAKSWGFVPKTIITYVKVKPDGSPSMKTGYYFRGATEHILFAVRGSLRLQTRQAFPTALLLPRLPHSIKPDEFFQMAEECSPAPRLELFARKRRPGWMAWGDEVESSIGLA